jgi:uncharacterized protein (DUF488 family)
MKQPFYTLGHSDRSFAEFAGLLAQAGIGLLADIRKLPGSRAHPHFDADALAGALAGLGIAYEHVAALGGLRGKAAGVPAEVNGLWRNASFHRYADYALSPAFRDGLAHVVRQARERRCALMCSEAVWWRCHRRIVADYLIAGGETVFHIMGKGRLEPARLTPGAVVRADGTIVYPAEHRDDA